MQTTLKNRKKVATIFSRSAFERKNIVEEGGRSGSRVKREHESIDWRAQKMMRGKVEPFAEPIVVRVVPTMVQVIRHTTTIPQMASPQEKQPKEQRQEIPQMTLPQERQLKEQNQGVKREHDIRFPKGEEHLYFEGDVCEDWMETTISPKHLQHFQQQQQQTHEGLWVNELQTERVVTHPTFEKFSPIELQVPPSRPEFTNGFPFEFELRRIMVHELGSSAEGSRNLTTQTMPKSMEEVVTKVMKANKSTELFQTMVIVNLNMGNLTMEVNIINNILVVGEKEKVVLQEKIDKEKDL